MSTYYLKLSDVTQFVIYDRPDGLEIRDTLGWSGGVAVELPEELAGRYIRAAHELNAAHEEIRRLLPADVE